MQGRPYLELEPIPMPSAEEFERKYRRPGRPALIRGALNDTFAFREWSFELFRERYGDRLLPMAKIHQHRLDFRNSDNVDYRDGLSFDEFMERLAEWEAQGISPERYVMYHQKDVTPELLDELPLPSFVPSDPLWFTHRIWLSGGDTRTPLHTDLPDNVFAQVVGHKRVSLFEPRNEFAMYRNPPWSAMPMASRLDVEEPDFERFPRFAKVQGWRTVVGPGDLLYIPRYWWHQLRSLDRSISVTYWWSAGLNNVVAQAALTYQKLRALRY